MSEGEYIWINRWWDFQYRLKEAQMPGYRPAWIKQYTRQLTNDDYLDLSAAQRGLLHDLRMLFAESRQTLLRDPAKISRRVGYKVRRDSLESLNHAGFITFVSAEEAQRLRSDRALEEEVEQETDVDVGVNGEVQNPSIDELLGKVKSHLREVV